MERYKILFSLFLLSFFLYSVNLLSQIYVSPDGINTNPGTIDQPVNIAAALDRIEPGDTIYLRGGTYSITLTISISKDGTAENKYHFFAYENERPVFDFSSMLTNSGNRGISLSGDYWHFKGIDIKGAGDNGMNISGSNNIIEFCAFYENRDTGLQLGGGASNNQIINCDSYYNADPGQGNADGFAPKLDVGTNNYFYGCRAWQNSDDGWDGYLRGADDVSTIVENSWCFNNGYLKDGSPSNGNGNGYKMGGGDNGNSANLAHDFTLIRSLAFDNRVKGFDQNNNRGSMTIYNCTGYRNGTNYSIPSSINNDETATVINSAVLGNVGNFSSLVVQQTNSWHNQFTVTNDDFISIDTTGVRRPRKPDGSLPDINFLHLANESDLIEAGTDIGLPFFGIAPDLGAFETDIILPVELISFSGAITNNTIILVWSTATELNNYGFEIQKRNPEKDEFYSIGFVNGTGTSQSRNEYKFTDKNVTKGLNIYRLKQVDFSGEVNYSGEMQIIYELPVEFSLYQNFPNPFNPATEIKFSIPDNRQVNLIIYNSLGEVVTKIIDNKMMQPGIHKIMFDAQDLSSGVYLYALSQGKNIITKKMLLIK